VRGAKVVRLSRSSTSFHGTNSLHDAAFSATRASYVDSRGAPEALQNSFSEGTLALREEMRILLSPALTKNDTNCVEVG
jgi:hypothetical protein